MIHPNTIEQYKKKFKCPDSLVWYSDASKHWNLEKLLADLKFTKGRKLSRKEVECLLAALCDIDLEYLHHQLGLNSLPGLRADIADQLGSYIKNLLELEENLRWENISRLLEKAGYLLNAKEAKNQFDSVSQKLPISASEIIKSCYLIIENNILKNDYSSKTSSSSQTFGLTQKKLGDEQFEQGNFFEAIEFYKVLAKEAPEKNFRFIVDIAQCFKKAKAYKDAIDMAFFALEIIEVKEKDHDQSEKKKHIARAYHIIAGCFRVLCLQKLDEDLLKLTLDHYKNVTRFSEYKYCLGGWNGLELQLQFIRRKGDTNYVRAMKLYQDFESIIENPESNFKQYADAILADRDKILEWLENSWLRDKLSNLENFLQ